jgi:RimJ/RimL family protein N-acetyltransferase
MEPTDLERLDPLDDKALAEVLAFEDAVRAADRPYQAPASFRAEQAFRRYGWDDGPGEDWLFRDEDGQLVATVGIHLPRRDNRHLAYGRVRVHPEHRRRGLGRRLFTALVTLARQPGRRLLVSGSLDAPAPRAYAEGLGFRQASVDITRRQDLPAVNWDRIERLRAETRAAASGYSLLRLTGPVPDDLVEEVAMMEAAINDAPRDDLDMEDDVITVERIRARERTVAEAGLREYKLIARRDRDGRLAGHTVVFIDPEQPRYGEQGDTSVLAAHRGHRLGMLLKSEMMCWLAEAEPQLTWVDTGNAESNRHMIAINETLGYRIVARNIGWQRDLG